MDSSVDSFKNSSEDDNFSNVSKNKINRRSFLSLLGIGALASSSLLSRNVEKEVSKVYDFNISDTDFSRTYLPNHHLLTPANLKAGDTVAFVAPASPVSMGQIAKYVSFFKSKSCKTLICDSIKKQNNNHRYLSNSDEMRAAELNELFRNPDVKAIICGRGGYGIMRILNMLDYKALRNYPKIIMGYSDITALLLSVYKHSNLVTYHGPVASSQLSDKHKKNLDQVLFTNEVINYDVPEMQVLQSGKMEGKLQGGNLTLISSTLGTDYEIDLSDSILFVEDVSILAHEFDRMMHQLLMNEKFKTCRGIIFGKMKKLTKRGNFYPNKSFTILEVMEQISQKINIPIAYNLPFGHVESNLIFPIGSYAEIDTAKKNIKIFRTENIK